MTKTIDQIVAELAAPFPVTQIEWRVGSTNASKDKGMALAYLTSRDVMERLDAVVGPFGWQIRHDAHDVGGKVTAHIAIKHPETGEWVWKSDGAGQTDVEGDKGSFSDAGKRAAVQWGVGRYLYAVDSPWVAIVPMGRSYRIADHELERLMGILPGNTGGIVAHTLTGQAKAPAKFWDEKNYSVLPKLPEKHLDRHGDANWADPETIAWLCAHVHKAIDKAPTKDALMKLQLDNLLWLRPPPLGRLPKEDAEAIMEGFRIRAEQFDQLQVKK